MTEALTDLRIAQKYVAKADHARTRGIEFNLPYTSFRNMMRAKKCQYTKVLLTDNGNQCPTDRTIDRIDSSKGYIKGNVVVVCLAANTFKSLFENPQSFISTKMAKKIIQTLESTRN